MMGNTGAYEVTYRLAHFFIEKSDPVTPSLIRRVERLAFAGQVLHTEGGTDNARHLFNVPQAEIDRMLQAGQIVAEAERRVVGDDDGDEDDETGGTSVKVEHVNTPLSDLAAWQLEEQMRDSEIPVNDLLRALSAVEGDERKAFAQRLIAAENEITGHQPREELSVGVASVLSEAHSEPTVAQTVTEEAAGGAEPTPGAVKFAEEHGVDLSQVKGTGTGGRVTQPDVQKHLAGSE